MQGFYNMQNPIEKELQDFLDQTYQKYRNPDKNEEKRQKIKQNRQKRALTVAKSFIL